MQHRRIPADDHRGMGEYMNEVDENGVGVRVKAEYVLTVGSKPSAQRFV